MSSTEQWLARTFVELADTLVDDFDVVDLLSTLAERCAELLDAAEVGLVLADYSGRLRVMSSSSERSEMLELFELQTDEGPCLQCFATGQQVQNVVLGAALQAWPRFAPVAIDAGIQTVHALPMRLRREIIGAVNVFHSDEHRLSDREFEIAQALADAATISILQERSIRSATQMAEQLQRALDSRIVIEQAKGVVAQSLSISVDRSFALLRRYARSNHLRLVELAERTVRLPREPEEALLEGLRLMSRGEEFA